MTAPDLSDAERAFLDRPDEPESIRERVIDALWLFMPPMHPNLRRGMAEEATDAVLAVITTPTGPTS